MWHCVISGGVIACQSARKCFKYYNLWYAVRFAWCYWEKISKFNIFHFLPASAVSVSDNFSSPHGDSRWGREKWLEVTVLYGIAEQESAPCGRICDWLKLSSALQWHVWNVSSQAVSVSSTEANDTTDYMISNNYMLYLCVYIYIYYPIYTNWSITNTDLPHVIIQYILYFICQKMYWTVSGQLSNIGYIGQFQNEATSTLRTRYRHSKAVSMYLMKILSIFLL